MNVRPEIDPVLSEDFAERVLARADDLVARRRLVHRAMVGAAALSLVSVAIISSVAMNPSRQSAVSQPAPLSVAALDATTEAQAGEPDALSDFFPDAGSVARFAAEYSDATDAADASLLSDQDPTL